MLRHLTEHADESRITAMPCRRAACEIEIAGCVAETMAKQLPKCIIWLESGVLRSYEPAFIVVMFELDCVPVKACTEHSSAHINQHK